MAALDFGMALARGLVAPDKTLQEITLKSAGGANIFKSEDWWNKQLNDQIKKGYSETKTKTEYLKAGFMGGGNQWADVQTNSGYFSNSMPNAVMSGGYFNRTPQTRTVTYEEQKDLTASQLSAITNQSKKNTQRIKSESDKQSSSKKRLSRGTGGLLSKAIMPGSGGMSTGLAELGKGGLGFDMALLNKGTTLG